MTAFNINDDNKTRIIKEAWETMEQSMSQKPEESGEAEHQGTEDINEGLKDKLSSIPRRAMAGLQGGVDAINTVPNAVLGGTVGAIKGAVRGEKGKKLAGAIDGGKKEVSKSLHSTADRVRSKFNRFTKDMDEEDEKAEQKNPPTSGRTMRWVSLDEDPGTELISNKRVLTAGRHRNEYSKGWRYGSAFWTEWNGWILDGLSSKEWRKGTECQWLDQGTKE